MSPIIGARGGLSASAYGLFSASLAGGGDYESIATVLVGSGGSSSITFSSIPSTYKHLQIRAIGKSVPADSSAGYDMTCYFNGDSTLGNYYNHYMYGNGSSTGAGANVNNAIWGGVVGNSPANVFSSMIMDILDYSSTAKYKVGRMIEGFETFSGGTNLAIQQSTLWSSTSAITSITFNVRSGTGFGEYTHFALYGISG